MQVLHESNNVHQKYTLICVSEEIYLRYNSHLIQTRLIKTYNILLHYLINPQKTSFKLFLCNKMYPIAVDISKKHMLQQPHSNGSLFMVKQILFFLGTEYKEKPRRS